MSVSALSIVIPIDDEFELNRQLARIAANVRILVLDSRILAKAGDRDHAAAMSVFALEELVKYRSLKEARKSAVAAGKTSLEVDGRIFGMGGKSHEFKLALAKDWKLIPDDAWEVHPETPGPPLRGPPNFNIQQLLDARLRLESIFVDYDQEKHEWVNPPLVNDDKLEYSNASILKAIEEESRYRHHQDSYSTR